MSGADGSERTGDALGDALGRANGVRFLCTGNVVRSAFAELYARHLGCPLPVDSAATRFQNDALFPETRRALAALGVEAHLLDAFRPRHLTCVPGPPDARLVVFAMSAEHADAWRARFPEHRPVFRFLELVGRHGDVADPVLEGARFEDAFASVALGVRALAERLRGRPAQGG